MPMSQNMGLIQGATLYSSVQEVVYDLESRMKAVQLLLTTVPDNERDGLKETPVRVAHAWKHWLGGYEIDPKELLKTFDDGAEGYDEMVLVKDLPFYSMCEHHLAPFFGRITI